MLTLVERLGRRAAAALSEKHGEQVGASLAIVRSSKPEFGELQCSAALQLAKALKQPPRALAELIASALAGDEAVARTEIAGPGFVNIHVKDSWLASELARSVALRPVGRGQRVVIDYSSPNVAKPMHIAHIRSTIIGDALKRVLRALDYQVIADNHLGDWGTQFGKLIVAWRRWLIPAAFASSPVDELLRLYVRFIDEEKAQRGTPKTETTLAAAAEESEDEGAQGPVTPLLAEARAELVKLQQGDPDNVALWKQFVAVSQGEFDWVYLRLGVEFDVTLGESFYNDWLERTVTELTQAGIAEESRGAMVVFFKKPDGTDEMPPMLVRKADGGFLYGTTDVAGLLYRMERWQPARILIVTDERQQLHFRQLFAVGRRLGVTASLEHIWFGLMRLPEGTISTREGKLIGLEVLLDEAERRAFEVATLTNPELPEAERRAVARVVGLGAVKYNDLSKIVRPWSPSPGTRRCRSPATLRLICNTPMRGSDRSCARPKRRAPSRARAQPRTRTSRRSSGPWWCGCSGSATRSSRWHGPRARTCWPIICSSWPAPSRPSTAIIQCSRRSRRCGRDGWPSVSRWPRPSASASGCSASTCSTGCDDANLNTGRLASSGSGRGDDAHFVAGGVCAQTEAILDHGAARRTGAGRSGEQRVLHAAPLFGGERLARREEHPSRDGLVLEEQPRAKADGVIEADEAAVQRPRRVAPGPFGVEARRHRRHRRQRRRIPALPDLAGTAAGAAAGTAAGAAAGTAAGTAVGAAAAPPGAATGAGVAAGRGDGSGSSAVTFITGGLPGDDAAALPEVTATGRERLPESHEAVRVSRLPPRSHPSRSTTLRLGRGTAAGRGTVGGAVDGFRIRVGALSPGPPKKTSAGDGGNPLSGPRTRVGGRLGPHADESFELDPELGQGREALLGKRSHRAHQRAAELPGHLWEVLDPGAHLAFLDPGEAARAGIGTEGMAAGELFEDQDAHREDQRALIEGLPRACSGEA